MGGLRHSPHLYNKKRSGRADPCRDKVRHGPRRTVFRIKNKLIKPPKALIRARQRAYKDKLVYTRILDKGQSKGYIVKKLKESYSSLGLAVPAF